MSELKKRRRRRHSTAANEGSLTLATPLKATLIALPITLVLGLCLLLVATALLLSTKDPDHYHGTVALPMLYLTAFLGGMITVRIAHRHSPFVCGVCEGILLVALFSFVALILPDTLSSAGTGYVKFFLRLVIIPASLLGAFLGAREKKHKRRRH